MHLSTTSSSADWLELGVRSISSHERSIANNNNNDDDGKSR